MAIAFIIAVAMGIFVVKDKLVKRKKQQERQRRRRDNKEKPITGG